MIIVGITGAISHGKTTFGNLLDRQSRQAQHFESWELVAEVANTLRAENPSHPAPNDLDAINQWLFPLADIVEQFMHTTINYTDVVITPEKLAAHPKHYAKLSEYLELVAHDPSLGSIDITADNKHQLRPLLQWLGGFLVIVGGGGIWYDEILRRTIHAQIGGCDLVTVGGVRYPADAERLRNAGGVIIRIERPDLPHRDSGDITERERDLIEPDCTILNNGTLSDLEHCAKQVYGDLMRRQLATAYAAVRTSDETAREAVTN